MNIEFLNQFKPPQEGAKRERRKTEEMNQIGLSYIYT
jgi:hypothetical protein